MQPWPKRPIIYEINTWVWLNELSRRHGRDITLATVPPEEWDDLAAMGSDAVWLMGVWERSPAGTDIALGNQLLLADFRKALPDLEPSDIVGSPYCIAGYRVDEHLGGPEGLALARESLSIRGLRLILDFVPNHVAPDHPWVRSHPDYFVRGSEEDIETQGSSFIEVEGTVFARGKDPYFPAWPDVLQLNAFHHGLRHAVIETLSGIAGHCDGVRCDMAMLVMSDVFETTWGTRAGVRPAREYWPEVIEAVRQRRPGFLFIAEAYWDLEWELQQQGFDFCYDKLLYDRLGHESAESVKVHLLADRDYQDRLLRFIENHDEPRAAAAFPRSEEVVAAITAYAVPGAKLFHEGQIEGRKVKLPVFLGRRPEEPIDESLRGFYQKLLRVINSPALRDGEWRLCERIGWTDNATYLDILAWCWLKDDERYLSVVNLSAFRSQARVMVPWRDLSGSSWSLVDIFHGTTYEREGSEMVAPGLYIDLDAWGSHFFRVERAEGATRAKDRVKGKVRAKTTGRRKDQG